MVHGVTFEMFLCVFVLSLVYSSLFFILNTLKIYCPFYQNTNTRTYVEFTVHANANILTLASCYCNSAESELNLINTNWGKKRHRRERLFPRGLSSSCLFYLYWTLCLKQIWALLFTVLHPHTHCQNLAGAHVLKSNIFLYTCKSLADCKLTTTRGPENIL